MTRIETLRARLNWAETQLADPALTPDVRASMIVARIAIRAALTTAGQTAVRDESRRLVRP